MASQPTSPLPAGQVLEISFATFTPRITIHSARELTVEIVAGDGAGFSDTVEYEAVAVRDGSQGPVVLGASGFRMFRPAGRGR
jgi:hypothetical protein